MPPVFNVNLGVPPNVVNNSVEYILEISLPSDENSTKSGYQLADDHAGAMWFTVAVVLVYGVGTIGLLGITARRNRAMELMDKEVNAYLESKFSAGGWADSGRKQIKVKKPVYELIRTSDPNSQKEKLVWALKTKEETTVYQSTSFYRKPKPKLIRAKTWAGALTKSLAEMRSSEAASYRTSGPILPVISECCDSALSDPDLGLCEIQEKDKLTQASATTPCVMLEKSSPLLSIENTRASFS